MGLIVLGVVAVVVVLLVVFLICVYNGLVKLRLNVREAWAGIDVQLKRRSSLIPNLVETVKGYAAHEKETLEAVTRARSRLDSADGAADKALADNVLTQALGRLFAVTEAYPDLKADAHFLELQRELTDTEDKIAYARQFYNTNVGNYNEKRLVFPNVLLAGMFGFTEEEFYRAEEGAREDVTVSFA